MSKNNKFGLLAKDIMFLAFAVILIVPYVFMIIADMADMIVYQLGISISGLIAIYGTIKYG